MNAVFECDSPEAAKKVVIEHQGSPALLEKEEMQSRLLRYTIYDDHEKQGPHPAVVQLNEMGHDVERCHSFLQVFFRNTDGVVVAYDTTVSNALSRLSSDMELVKRYTASRNPKIFLLGYIPTGRVNSLNLVDIHTFCVENGVCNLGAVPLANPSALANAFSCVSFRVLRPLFTH